MGSINNRFFLSNVLIWIVLYIYVNNPLFQVTNGIGSIKLLYPFSLFYLFINLKIALYFAKILSKEMFIFLLLVLFAILRTAFGGDESYIRIFAVAFFENLVIPVSIAIYIFKSKNANWLDHILIVGITGSIISVLALVNPGFNYDIKGLQVLSEYSSKATFRSFGLADGLTYSYGISQAIILSVLISNSKDRLKYLLFSPLLIISCLFNARTGMLIVGLVLLYEILVYRRTKLLIALAISIISFNVFSDLLISTINNEDANLWVNSFFTEVGDLLMGTSNADYSSAEVLMEDMYVLPSNAQEWIIGSGQSSYLSFGANTDVGFFLQLKYGGLLFVMILYSLIILMISKTISHKNLRWFSALLIISFFIGNIKGDFIPSTGAFRLLFFMYICLLFNHRRMSHKMGSVAKYNFSLNR